jgi:hypothetical protein
MLIVRGPIAVAVLATLWLSGCAGQSRQRAVQSCPPPYAHGPTATVDLSVRSDSGLVRAASGRLIIRVYDGRSHELSDIRPETPGVVVTLTRTPAANATADEYHSVTDTFGIARFGSVPAASYRMAVPIEDYGPFEREVRVRAGFADTVIVAFSRTKPPIRVGCP